MRKSIALVFMISVSQIILSPKPTNAMRNHKISYLIAKDRAQCSALELRKARKDLAEAATRSSESQAKYLASEKLYRDIVEGKLQESKILEEKDKTIENAKKQYETSSQELDKSKKELNDTIAFMEKMQAEADELRRQAQEDKAESIRLKAEAGQHKENARVILETRKTLIKLSEEIKTLHEERTRHHEEGIKLHEEALAAEKESEELRADIAKLKETWKQRDEHQKQLKIEIEEHHKKALQAEADEELHRKEALQAKANEELHRKEALKAEADEELHRKEALKAEADEELHRKEAQEALNRFEKASRKQEDMILLAIGKHRSDDGTSKPATPKRLILGGRKFSDPQGASLETDTLGSESECKSVSRCKVVNKPKADSAVFSADSALFSIGGFQTGIGEPFAFEQERTQPSAKHFLPAKVATEAFNEAAFGPRGFAGPFMNKK